MTPETLSPEVLAVLAKLHDIRMADPIGWWPLAPGWWGLLALSLVLICVGLALVARHHRSLRVVALGELKRLRQRLEAGTDPQQISVDLAVLLRRVSLASDKRDDAGHIAGADWAQKLGAGPAGFSPATAHFLAQAPYAPAATTDLRAPLTAAFTETERWIRSYA